MDPLTAIGAVASIWQIAQAALSLSKTLYTLSAAVGSASEDIQLLADDLKTFSQSLTLLSRLLEDSKSWYSDDIYLLTAKIIKDCADLYVKIDKILEKLGGNGKRTWKVRVKFVYKESQIQKLLSRLRDMKGTLATILMSLQVDLQLSLLNISSTSKIQRPPERPLQPETLRVLQEASESIMAGGILTKYSIQSEETVQVSEKGVRISTTRCRIQQLEPQNTFSVLSTTHSTSDPPQPQHGRSSSNNFDATRSFIVLPPNIDGIPSVMKRETIPTLISRTVSPSKKVPDDDKLRKKHLSRRQDSSSAPPDHDHAATRSLKSSSSAESFKSAMSIQEQDLDVARKVKAIQSVMHAFRTALQILSNLIKSRISGTDEKLFFATEGLEQSLIKGSNRIEQHHINHFKQHGQAYLQLFGPTTGPDKVQSMGSEVMKNIVMKLHEYSAEYEDLHASQFDDLTRRSDDISIRAVHHLTYLASKLASNSRSLSEFAHTQELHGIDWFARQNVNQSDQQLFSDCLEHKDNILDQFNDDFFSDAFPLEELGGPSKNDLTQYIDEKQNEDEDVVPGENASQILTCNTIWDRLQACPKVKDGEFDLDLLCNDLQKKAKCSKSGAVVSESDFNKIMKSYVEEKSAEPDHDEDEMPELFYHPGMRSPPLNRLPLVITQNNTPQLLPPGSYRSNDYSQWYSASRYHPSAAGAYPPKRMNEPDNSEPIDNYSKSIGSDESDLEAAAGLIAMRITEKQACGNNHSEYKDMGLGLVGGGYDAHMSYGGDTGEIHPFPSPSSFYPDRSCQSSGLKRVNPRSLHLPCTFDDDIDFTASVAAGLQDSGFDPNIVINDPSFRRRESPPGFDGPGTYPTPFAEATTNLGVLPPPAIGSDESRFVLGEVTSAPKYWWNASSLDETFETPTKLSKKEQKKRDKEMARTVALAEEEVIKHTNEQIIEGPERDAEISRKSSRKSKEDAGGHEESDVEEDMDAEEDSEEEDNNAEAEQSTTGYRRKRRRERRNQLLDVEAEVEEEENFTNLSITNKEDIVLPDVHSDAEEEGNEGIPIARSWTNSPNLRQILVHQETMDPTTVFGHPGPFDMEEVFSKSQERFHSFRPRMNSDGVPEANVNLDAMRKDLEIRKKHRGEKRYHYDHMDAELEEEKDGGSSSLDPISTAAQIPIQTAPATNEPQQPSLTRSKEYQEYQKQLLATVPSYRPHDDTKSCSYPQPIELTPAQIEQQKQATRDYRLSIMPGHDPDSKESINAHSKALQDYQMSLIVLDCWKHTTPRLKMRRISDENDHITSDLSKVTPQPAAISQGTSFPTGLDALQEFDFDSFLHDESNPGCKFQCPELSGADLDASKDEKEDKPTNSDETVQTTADPTVASTGKDDILFVNEKQFHRIIKRRIARQQLAEHLATKKRKTETSSRSGREAQDTHEIEANGPDIEEAQATQKHNTEPEILEPLHSTLPFRPAHSNTDVETEDFVVEEVELASTYPALSPAQTSKLWWQAYISLVSTASSESLVFDTIMHSLKSELGVLASRHVPDQIICRRISTNIRRLGKALHDDKPQFTNILEIRSNILRILTTVDEQLGLEIATLGWSCVYVLLSLYEKILTASPATQIPSTFLWESFSRLQTVVSIIARYAVMENLYQHSGGALSLKPEYRSALISLCSDVLQYFATAFAYAEDEINSKGPKRDPGEVRVLPMPVSLAEGGWQGSLQKCGFLVQLIKQKDIACQGFKVVVDTKNEDSDESDSDEADVEELSDDDWERIESVDADVGVEAQMETSA